MPILPSGECHLIGDIRTYYDEPGGVLNFSLMSLLRPTDSALSGMLLRSHDQREPKNTASHKRMNALYKITQSNKGPT